MLAFGHSLIVAEAIYTPRGNRAGNRFRGFTSISVESYAPQCESAGFSTRNTMPPPNCDSGLCRQADAKPATKQAASYVIQRYRNQANLRTRFRKIIKRAGLTPWPKLFQNLRSTRQTELAAQYPLHVVCAWIGNKAAVAAEHYLQVTDADFDNAAAQELSQRAANALHSSDIGSAQDHSPEMQKPAIKRARALVTTGGHCGKSGQMGGEGLASSSSSTGKTSFSDVPCAQGVQSAQSTGRTTEVRDARLARLVATWPALSVDIREAIMRLAEG